MIDRARSDCEIAIAVHQQLKASAHRPLRSLCCECRDGAVTIRGVVDSFYHKQLAQELARRVKGVSLISNAVVVNSESLLSEFSIFSSSAVLQETHHASPLTTTR